VLGREGAVLYDGAGVDLLLLEGALYEGVLLGVVDGVVLLLEGVLKEGTLLLCLLYEEGELLLGLFAAGVSPGEFERIVSLP